MGNEEKLRLHRCCFFGNRPRKNVFHPDKEIKEFMDGRIGMAVRDGYTTYITNCARGFGIWAAQCLLEKKIRHPELRLIAAVPWPGYPEKFEPEWRTQYEDLLLRADLVVKISEEPYNGVLRERNKWMVDHSNRMIAYLDLSTAGTYEPVDYAARTKRELYLNFY